MYRSFVPNTGSKRNSLQMMIFVNVFSTWSIVEIKTRLETCITRNDVNGVFHLSYLITLMAYLCSQWTPNVQIKYYMFNWLMYRLYVVNRGWKRDSRQIMIFVYVSSTWSIGEHKTRFETWITRSDVNGVNLFYLYYLITLIAYLWLQWTPNVQMKYFMFDWSFYRLFVLNTAWKRDFLQVMRFVNICPTGSIVQIKTRFETWLTRNDVSLFDLSYLITLMDYLCSQRSPNAQINYFMFDWLIYSVFVLNRRWKSDTRQIMVFVYVLDMKHRWT
jgi:hypothetical protein